MIKNTIDSIRGLLIILMFIPLFSCSGLSEKMDTELKADNQSTIESENKQTAHQTEGTSSGEVTTEVFNQTYNAIPKWFIFLLVFLTVGVGLTGWLTDSPNFPYYVYIGGWLVVLSCYIGVFVCGIYILL